LIIGDAIPLTGDSGLMMKNWLVALFSGSIISDGSTLQVLLATSTANCGISSTFSLLVIRYGFPPTLVDLLQEMGCVYWGAHSADDLQDSYHIYLNCNLYLSLFLQIKQEPSAKERSIQTNDLMDVLRNCCYFQNSATILHWRLTLRIPISKVFKNHVFPNVLFVMLITLSSPLNLGAHLWSPSYQPRYSSKAQ
jgi:hypothetical protein